MMGTGPAAQASAPEPDPDTPWTTRALIARHKRLAAATAVGIAVLILLFLSAVLGPKAGAVVNGTSCAQWGSSTQTEQQAYAQQYLNQYGHLPGGADGLADVEASINNGCMAAYSSDEEDTVTVLDAIEGRY